jgi:hypothetical protein
MSPEKDPSQAATSFATAYATKVYPIAQGPKDLKYFGVIFAAVGWSYKI